MREKIKKIFKWSQENKIKAKLIILSILWMMIIMLWLLFTFINGNEIMNMMEGIPVSLGTPTSNY